MALRENIIDFHVMHLETFRNDKIISSMLYYLVLHKFHTD